MFPRVLTHQRRHAVRCAASAIPRNKSSISSPLHKYYSDNLYNQQRRYSSSNSDVTWLWRASDTLVNLNHDNKFGTRTGMGKYTFNSIKPLDEDIFRLAFDYFLKKFPHLKTVIRQRGDEFWCCHPHQQNIDFEIWTDQNTFKQDCFDLLSKGFHENESIQWRARLVEQDSEAECHVEGVKAKYPYQYDLMMLYNHIVGDGIDSLVFMNGFHQILDSLVGGKTISDDLIGVYEDNHEIEQLLNHRKEQLLQDQTKYNTIKDSLPILGHIPETMSAFRRSKLPSKVTTKNIHRIINPKMAKGLLSKCSEKGITFHTLSVAIMNVALTQLMMESGVEKDSYKLFCLNLINTRQFMTLKDHLNGFHALTYTFASNVDKNVTDIFWDYCQQVHHEFKSYFTREKTVLDQIAVNSMIESTYPKFNYIDNPRPSSHDFGVANLGDFTYFMNGEGESVQMTNAAFYQLIHKHKHSILQQIATFRGTTRYTLMYDTAYYTEEVVNRIADRILHLFEVFGK